MPQAFLAQIIGRHEALAQFICNCGRMSAAANIDTDCQFYTLYEQHVFF
jgi:hypothetical protein